MKSAYELAMDRLGGVKPLGEAQREELAEIDRRYDAKIAEVRLALDQKVKNAGAGSASSLELARDEAVRDLARLEEQRETAKNKVRDNA